MTTERNIIEQPARAPSIVDRTKSFASAILVVALLAGFAVFGYRTEWTFGLGPISHIGTATETRRNVQVNLVANEPGHVADVILNSAEDVERWGIDFATIWTAPITDAITANAEVLFDPARTARLTARVAGSAWRVNKMPGDVVQAGDIVALIDSAEVGKVKSEFEQSLVRARAAQRILDDTNRAGTAVTPLQRQEIEAAHREAEIKLSAAEQALMNLKLRPPTAELRGLAVDDIVLKMRFLGIPDGAIGDQTASANLLPIKSPIAGVVLSSDVVVGEVLDPARQLFVVVDPSALLLMMHVAQQRLGAVKIGQEVRFRPDGLVQEFTGKITSIGTALDEATRTIAVRAVMDNADGRLRASSLGQARIVLRQEPNAVVVPSDCVFKLNGQSAVFVLDPKSMKPDQPKSFQLRIIATGAIDGDKLEVTGGLKSGDVIASKGAIQLWNEYQREAASHPTAPATNERHAK